MKQGTFEQMKERKKNLPREILDQESDSVYILVVPAIKELATEIVWRFQRKPTDEEVKNSSSSTIFCVRRYTIVGSSIIVSDPL